MTRNGLHDAMTRNRLHDVMTRNRLHDAMTRNRLQPTALPWDWAASTRRFTIWVNRDG